MQIQCVALLFLCFSAVLDARRVETRKRELQSVGSGKGQTCHVEENARSLKYGIKGSWKVKSCMVDCKFFNFLTVTMKTKVIADAQEEEIESKKHCKCYTAARFWNKVPDKKFWFEFNMKGGNECSKEGCYNVFLTWGNMFNKKKAYPGDNERMPVDKFIESQEGYEFRCDESAPEGLILPSPHSKIHELRLQIERCTDPDEKLKLEQLLAELMKDKDVEIFEYALEEDWGPERQVDVTSESLDELEEHHTFFLKPCKSQNGREVTDLKEIYEQCGQPELGISLKTGQIKKGHYEVDEPWGPERECKPNEEECQLIQNIAKDEGVEGEILTFRLRPCIFPATETEITELKEIFAEKGCGDPTTHPDSDGFATLLPVKMDVALQYDQEAPDADLTYPCTD